MKFSIITPSFNQGFCIEETILSILNQEGVEVELIVIDGGSTDNTVEILKKYSDRLAYWVSEPDNGQSNAINKGLSKVTGDYVNWINSDDQLTPGALKTIQEVFETEKVDIICGYSELLYDGFTPLKRTSQPGNNLAKWLATGHFMQPSTFFKTEVFKKYTPVNESLHFMMDQNIWWNYILENGFDKVAYIDLTVAKVLMHEDAKSVSMIDKFLEDRIRLFMGLFNTVGLKWNIPITCENPLEFKNIGPNWKKAAKSASFYLLYDLLFERDHMGNRIKIRPKVFHALITRYPFKTFRKYLSKS